MKIKTKFHGTVEVIETQIITFSHGIPGFETETQFILLEESPFTVLQSIKNENVSFIMSDPWVFVPTYEFDLSDSVISGLNIQSPEELRIYNILTIPAHAQQVTMNLLAPIVIHKENRNGMQVVLEGSSYTTKHSICIEGC